MIAFDFMCWSIGILIDIFILVIICATLHMMYVQYKDNQDQKALKEELDNPKTTKTRRREIISP